VITIEFRSYKGKSIAAEGTPPWYDSQIIRLQKIS
jgi:hypothetical protein